MFGYIDGYNFGELNAMKYLRLPPVGIIKRKKIMYVTKFLAAIGSAPKRKTDILQNLSKMKMVL